jgi:hypothetical protein
LILAAVARSDDESGELVRSGWRHAAVREGVEPELRYDSEPAL